MGRVLRRDPLVPDRDHLVVSRRGGAVYHRKAWPLDAPYDSHVTQRPTQCPFALVLSLLLHLVRHVHIQPKQRLLLKENF